MHSTETGFVIGPSNTLFDGVYACTFKPGNLTCWGSAGVKCSILFNHLCILIVQFCETKISSDGCFVCQSISSVFSLIPTHPGLQKHRVGSLKMELSVQPSRFFFSFLFVASSLWYTHTEQTHCVFQAQAVDVWPFQEQDELQWGARGKIGSPAAHEENLSTAETFPK